MMEKRNGPIILSRLISGRDYGSLSRAEAYPQPKFGTQHIQRREQTPAKTNTRLDEAEQSEGNPTLSIIVPVYNIKESLPAILHGLITLAADKEILLVDDGSTDGTAALATEFASQHEELSVLLHDRNRGRGSVLRTGFAAARGDVVVILGYNLLCDPNDILMLIKPILANCCDVLYGSHSLLSSQEVSAWPERFRRHILTSFSNFCTGQNLSGTESSIKAFRRSVITGLPIRQNRHGVEAELIARLSYRGKQIYEMPITATTRDMAKRYGIWQACQRAWFILRHTVVC